MDWSNLYTQVHGRISRRSFWIGFIALLIIETAVFNIAARYGDDRLGAVIDLFFVYPEFALLWKRAQDRDLPLWPVVLFFGGSVLLDFLNVTGWSGPPSAPTPLFLAILLPWVALGIGLLIDLGFRPGTQGPNQHGPEPA